MATNETTPFPVDKQAYKLACSYLARREYSRHDLMQKLLQKGFGLSVVENVLGYLQTQDLLSETRFVENYVAYRINRGYGPIRIRAELTNFGVNEELIRQCLSSRNVAWSELAQRALEKRFKEPATSYREYQKQIQFLVYRGFELTHLSDILEQAALQNVMC